MASSTISRLGLDFCFKIAVLKSSLSLHKESLVFECISFKTGYQIKQGSRSPIDLGKATIFPGKFQQQGIKLHGLAVGRNHLGNLLSGAWCTTMNDLSPGLQSRSSQRDTIFNWDRHDWHFSYGTHWLAMVQVNSRRISDNICTSFWPCLPCAECWLILLPNAQAHGDVTFDHIGKTLRHPFKSQVSQIF